MNNQDAMQYVNSITGSVEYAVLSLTPNEIEDIYVHQNVHSIHIGETPEDPFIVIGLEVETLTVMAIDKPFSRVLLNWLNDKGTDVRADMQNELNEYINHRLSEMDINYDYSLKIQLAESNKDNIDNGVLFIVTHERSLVDGIENSFDWAEPEDGRLIKLFNKTVGAVIIGTAHLKDFFYEQHLSQSKKL